MSYNFTNDEINEWLKDKSINPRTKRKIKIGKTVYCKLDRLYRNNIEKKSNSIETKKNNVTYNLIDSVDDRDPISMNMFWEEIDGVKIIVYPENMMDQLVYYYDKSNLLRCFEIDSIMHLKKYKMFNHPITQEPIPKEIFDINKMNINKIEFTTLESYALKVFQLFNKSSIFIDSKLFLETNKYKLLRINYELNRLWNSNFNDSMKDEITKEYKEIVSYELNIKDIDTIKRHILDNIKVLLECNNNKYKYIINIMVLYCLALIIPEIRDLYPDVLYSFS